jgi:YegS/Rv2252/BmrU family lipid kinase
MRKAVLLYNPRSGSRRDRARADLESSLRVLRAAEVEASLTLTQSREDAAELAREAVLEGSDVVFACGGDGTIHDVLQGLAGSQTALGVLPMGTANALAHDLGLPLDPTGAARAALTAEPRRVALGRISFQDLRGAPATKFFTVAVGIGIDAHLFYKLQANSKQRLGMAAYYAKAWQLWFTHHMERFQVECHEPDTGQKHSVNVTELLAVRIRNFGGVLQELAPGASLHRDDLRVVLCRTSSRFSYLLYVARGLLQANWKVDGIDLVHSTKICCDQLVRAEAQLLGPARRVYVEADGELIGTLPAEITMVPDALTIMIPKTRAWPQSHHGGTEPQSKG